jgi:Undecaprenyl-phosphate glucose phosphotransferase
MLKFQVRKLAAALVALDVAGTAVAWIAAYLLRFHSGRFLAVLPPVTKGVPPVSHYLVLLPFICLLWPTVLYFHGLYQVRRGRSRIDEFFAILFSVLIASALTLGATLYVRVYYAAAEEWEYSRVALALFVVLDLAAINGARAAFRRWLQRRWAAGENVKRVLVAGAGELGHRVADTILAHRELGYRVVGFLDDERTGEIGGVPVLGPLADTMQVAGQYRVDQLYIALPLEEHARLVQLIRSVSNECLDIKVVPDLVQYATIRADLEDLDGIPIISLNEVPLRGWSSMAKRVMDMVVGSIALLSLTIFVPLFPVIALLIRWKGGPGPILLRQERMTLDGKTFYIYKFRTMVVDAERDTGPIWAQPEDPRRTPVGVWLRRFNLDELPQLINVVLGDMSLVGPRPERPPFVRQFKQRIPQYMLRHRVKSGITGWAQVNGWRGNTSLEKRIEYDLYYIENWSLLLDIKILILTLLRGFGQKHAY